MLMKIKRFLNRLGYDLKIYRSVYDHVIPPLGIRTVIDVGANEGFYSKESRARFPDARIYAFEPLPGCFEKLNNKMVGDDNFKSWNIALGESDGKAVMEESSFHPSSSLLHMTELHKKLYPKSAKMTPREVEIQRLDDVLKSESLEGPILVKMDVQGFEDKVIKGGRETLKKASVAVIETSYVRLYERQPLFDDIYRLMRELGYSYYGDAHRHYDGENRLIYEDAVFLKSNLMRTT